MASKAQVKASNKYNKANTTSFTFRFNNESDSDIINHLQSLDNKSGYIKKIIRNDIGIYINKDELQQALIKNIKKDQSR